MVASNYLFYSAIADVDQGDCAFGTEVTRALKEAARYAMADNL